MQGYTGFRLAEFTYSIWPNSVPEGTRTHWFYSSVLDTKGTCHTPEKSSRRAGSSMCADPSRSTGTVPSTRARLKVP
jgi:hypothetical protein